MEMTIRGDNITITSDLEDFVRKKLDKLNRYLPNITSLYVELSRQNSNRGPDIVVAQITLRHKRGAILRTEEKMDMTDNNVPRTAVSAATDKMYRRIRRFKDKPRSKRVRERFTLTQEELQTAEELPEAGIVEASALPAGSDEQLDTILDGQIIRRKEVSITAMNEEEAIEQMELLGHTFFMFFNADTNTINVVYKRSNSGYGLLQPHIE